PTTLTVTLHCLPGSCAGATVTAVTLSWSCARCQRITATAPRIAAVTNVLAAARHRRRFGRRGGGAGHRVLRPTAAGPASTVSAVSCSTRPPSLSTYGSVARTNVAPENAS